MLGFFRRALSTLLAALLLILLGSPLAPTARAYTDDPGAWYSGDIQKARDYGLMVGYPDGRFGVGDSISRAEFVSVLSRMFSWEPVSPESPTFSDCSPSYWAYPSVEAAAVHGVADPGQPFRPAEPITRSEMAVMLVKALGYDGIAQSLSRVSLPFDDADGDTGYLAVAYHVGMLSGVPGPNGTLKCLPHNSAPREQAAAMLVRVFERYTSKTDWLHGFYAFSSFSQLDLALQMDAVSLGWARLSFDPQTGPWVNSTYADGNEWVIPSDPDAATVPLRDAGVPCNLNVYADTSQTLTLSDGTVTSVLERLLSSPADAALAVEALTDAAAGYAGLTIDFEGLKGEEWREPYAGFLARLRAALPPDKSLWVCVPPDTWYHGYDYRAIGESCDRVILMAHDYQWTSVPRDYLGLDNTYSPVTPIVQVYTALLHLTDAETGISDRSKLAIQISFGTAGFHVDSEGFLLDTTIYHPSPDTIARRLAQPDSQRVWDEESCNPRLNYTVEDGEHYTLWYEDAQSVDAKLSLARMFGVTGVSVWRLGTIPVHPELEQYDTWSVFADRQK